MYPRKIFLSLSRRFTETALTELLPISDVDEFTMASMYGYIGVISQMVKAAPERFFAEYPVLGGVCSAVSIFCVFLKKEPGKLCEDLKQCIVNFCENNTSA